MTPAETTRLVALITRRWPHSEIPGPDVYAEDLAAIDGDHARAAIDRMYRDGRQFAPNGGQIIDWIARAAIDAPDWGEVKAEIDRRRAAEGGARWVLDGRTCPEGLCDGRGLIVDEDARTSRYCPCRQQMQIEMAAAAGTHPLVTLFILEVGRTEIAALDGDRIAEAQVRDKWKAFIDRVRRGVAGSDLPTVGLPALERLQNEHHQRGELLGVAARAGLRRPDLRAQLERAGDER